MAAEPPFRATPTRWDIALLAVLFLMTVSSIFAFHALKPRGETILISANGKTLGFYPLDRDRIIRAVGPVGTTVIQIKNGQAAIIQAPCAHKLCQKMGPIPSRGRAMICIPNRIVVEIKEKTGQQTDAITR